MELRTVYVVSWHGESFGGFDWYFTEADAREAFGNEENAWKGEPVSLRLVALEVEAGDNAAITDEIDGRLDEIEVSAPVLAEAVTE